MAEWLSDVNLKHRRVEREAALSINFFVVLFSSGLPGQPIRRKEGMEHQSGRHSENRRLAWSKTRGIAGIFIIGQDIPGAAAAASQTRPGQKNTFMS